MPPKGKGKKGKKGDDDGYWDNAGESAAISAAVAPPAANTDDTKPAPKSAFAGLSFSAEFEGGGDNNDDDGDNLMTMLQKRKDKKKDKKKQKAVDFDDGPPPGQGSDGEASAAKGDISAPQKPKEMTAEELADEEFGPVKGKKGKKKKGANKPTTEEKDDEDEAAPEASEAKDTPAPAKSEPVPDADDDDGDAGDGPKLLSKKEKEKLKKEKERAKKKAQAAAKKAEKAAGGGEDEAPPPTPTSAPAPSAAAEGGDEDEGGEGATSKNKKKKKKKKKGEDGEDEDKPAPAATATAKTAGKKGGGSMGLSALRAMMEEKKRLEEEARRKIEEEQRRIEEEERRAAEEAKRKEEERIRKKEKEKAKKDQLRKEGKLLTPKQKAESQAAERRKQALLASGAVIAGLAGGAPAASGSGAKKVVYGKKKTTGAQQVQGAGGSQAASSTPGTPQTAAPVALPPPPESVASGSIRSPPPTPPPEPEKDWDEESEGKKGEKDDGVKSDWDASSGEEGDNASPAKVLTTSTPAPAKVATPAPTAKSAPSAPAAKSNGTPVKTAPAPAKPPVPTPAKGAAAPAGTAAPSKKAAAPPEESEEESEEEDDSDDDDDDDDDDDSEEEDSEDDLTTRQRMEAERKAAATARRKQREEEARAAASKDNLRSPICCILGHVDTGKTKLLDKIRQTNVQEGEAGGITQQIGATYFPVEAIKTKTAVVNKDGSFEYKIPGLLIIDTPGHESFTNLRSRGSSLCNIAILVVDIMHGLEPQTIESLGLLKQGKTPFIIALNKIDRLYGWKATPDNGVQDSLSQQSAAVIREFEKRSQDIIVEIAAQGLNSELYWKNKNPRGVVNIVPTSAITGEGIPDMIKLLVDLTQTRMVNSLMYISTLECTVLEVKVIEGLGTTIDIILSNGYLREGDKIVICGLNGPIITQIRALLTPQPLRELRIKSQYVHNKEVKAANGVKVVAPDLDKAIAGSKLLVCGPDDDEDDLMEEIMRPLEDLLKRISKTQVGVHVQASTLGSLEALLSFLEDSKIPVSGINIGPVHKKDVRRVMPQLEKAQEMACILCFDVPIDKEAEKLADESGIKLFKADIIYHLFDAFTAYNKEITEAKRKDAAPQAVWPCRLKIIAVFAKRDPIIVGVDIIEGSLRVGTPICVVKEKEVIRLGRITSLEINHKPMEIVKRSQAGGGVAVKIEHAVYETAKMAGRHFDENDELLSMISRQSIDVLKDTFRNDVSKEEWVLVKNLKARLNIP